MKKLKVLIQKIHEDAKIPNFVHDDDSGADLFSVENAVLKSQEIKLIGTGIKIAVPKGFEAQIRPKSGLAINHGITILNTPGTIDAGYRGEVKVILANFGKETFKIEKGQKIAQLVFNKIEIPDFKIKKALPESKRKEGGFGSTGLK